MPAEDSLRRSGAHRVAEIRAGGRVSSGFAVAADLVLTTRHGLGDADTCRIRPLGGDPADAAVVWRGSSTVDAALLRVPSAPWRDDPGIAWTRWGTPEGDGVPVVARGFPKAKAGEGARDLETMRGTVDHATGLVAGRHSVDIATPELLSGEDGYWRGMSGAVALAEPALQVIGVVAFDPAAYRGRRLELIPAAELLGDAEFAALVGCHAETVEHVARREVSTVDTLLTPPSIPLPAEHSDWQLLLPRYAVVPFQGRDEVRPGLLGWCRGPRAFDLAVITGEGGAGKTRLAAQICAEITAEGWDSGFIADDALLPPPEVLRPTLLVVDYAEPHAEAVGAFIRAMNARGHGPPVRLLLVARTDVRDGRWWRDLNARSEGLAEHLRPPLAPLNSIPLSIEERGAHAAAALTAFGAAPGTELPALDTPEYSHPMRLHMAALLTAREEEPGTREGVLGQFLAREERLWLDAWTPAPDDEDRILTGQAVALVALASPLRTEAGDVLAALPDVDGPVRRRLTRWLATVFPGGERRLVFGPDILTEELLDRTEDLPVLLDGLIDATADRAGLARILETARLAAGSARVRAALTHALAAHLPRLAASALSDDKAVLAPALDTALRLLTRDPRLRPALNAACAEVAEGIGDQFRHWPLRATIAAGAADRYKTVGDARRFAETAADLAVYWLQDRRIDLAAKIVADALRTRVPVPLLHTAAAVLAFIQARPEEAAEHTEEAVSLNAGNDGHLAAAHIDQAVVRSWRRDLRGAATSLQAAAAIVGEDDIVTAVATATGHFPPWEPGGADAVPAGFLLHNRFGVPSGLPTELRRAAVDLTRRAVAALDTVPRERTAARAFDELVLAVSAEIGPPEDVGLYETVVAFVRDVAGDVPASSAGSRLVAARARIADHEGMLRDIAWVLPALDAAGASAVLRAYVKLDEAGALTALDRHAEARDALDEAEELAAGTDDPEIPRTILRERGAAASGLGEHEESLRLAEADAALAREQVSEDVDSRHDLLFSLMALLGARHELGRDTDDVVAEAGPLWRELRDDLDPAFALTTAVNMLGMGLIVDRAEVERLFERLRAARGTTSEVPPPMFAAIFVQAATVLLLLRHQAGLAFDTALADECRASITTGLDGDPEELARLDAVIALVRGRAGDADGAREALTQAGESIARIGDPDTAAELTGRVDRIRAELAAPGDPTPNPPD
ncbi:hypothetical protein [Phytomonospora endophytica]|uniref:Tetratricopeptide (TPR) repeat protein n=1 Tax=Phytomonospora endophytica TaxID=714109 RepID=A0A841G4I3_9ACTN|nr:hypothetical protein [Phytomonospora endophytica]MBB6039020.1 tetratricopeptide (TPR) repeat protein [Phytomonospora endophytica]GIG69498.1 hypothetical protein Pen01_57930 [Phytomonospora endophytica]